MGFDSSPALRYAADQALAVPSILGVAEYSVFLVKITNDQIDIDDTDTNRVVSITRILMADGYRSYASQDGYLNPWIEQEKGEQLIISNGKLMANKLLLGPLVFPYTWNGLTSGIDPQSFQPPIGSNNNITIYVQIKGNALDPLGNFFTVQEIKIDNMSGLTYFIVLKSNNLTVQGT